MELNHKLFYFFAETMLVSKFPFGNPSMLNFTPNRDIFLRISSPLFLYLNKIAIKINFNIIQMATKTTTNFKKPECNVECCVSGLIYQYSYINLSFTLANTAIHTISRIMETPKFIRTNLMYVWSK